MACETGQLAIVKLLLSCCCRRKGLSESLRSIGTGVALAESGRQKDFLVRKKKGVGQRVLERLYQLQ